MQRRQRRHNLNNHQGQLTLLNRHHTHQMDLFRQQHSLYQLLSSLEFQPCTLLQQLSLFLRYQHQQIGLAPVLQRLFLIPNLGNHLQVVVQQNLCHRDRLQHLSK
jgi:hypothetical protein